MRAIFLSIPARRWTRSAGRLRTNSIKATKAVLSVRPGRSASSIGDTSTSFSRRIFIDLPRRVVAGDRSRRWQYHWYADPDHRGSREQGPHAAGPAHQGRSASRGQKLGRPGARADAGSRRDQERQEGRPSNGSCSRLRHRADGNEPGSPARGQLDPGRDQVRRNRQGAAAVA